MPGYYGYGYSWKRSAKGWQKAFKAPEDVKKEKEAAETKGEVSAKSGKKSSTEPTLRKSSKGHRTNPHAAAFFFFTLEFRSFLPKEKLYIMLCQAHVTRN